MGPPSLGEGEDTSVPTQKRQDLKTKSPRCSPHAVRRDDYFGAKPTAQRRNNWRDVRPADGVELLKDMDQAVIIGPRGKEHRDAQRSGVTGASPP